MNRLSKIVYSNLATIFIIMILHPMIESINPLLIYIVLIVYAIIAGIIVQIIVNKETHLKLELSKSYQLSELAMLTVPSAIILFTEHGVIEFVNHAATALLGDEQSVVGTNIFSYDSIMVSGIGGLIQKGNKGEKASLNEVPFVLENKLTTRILNCIALPIDKSSNSELYRSMLVITDISKEIELIETIEKQYLNMFRSFAKFIDAKDEYTGFHSANVSKYVRIILRKLELNKQVEEDILIAANLHDIGKVGISDVILNKPGSLTADEFEQIKNHSVIGYQLLEEIEGYENIAKYIKYHHERWDGNGYPERLKENEIPLGSQIISVCDAYDAMTTDRVYRAGKSQKRALEILREESGKQFSPVIVDLFFLLMTDIE